jgi:hypothetical protein
MSRRTLLSAVALFALAPALAGGQVNVTPLIGGYVPASDWNQIKTGAQNVATKREGARSIGLNLEVGSFRGSLAYVSGTTIKDAGQQEIGNGNVFGLAADAVIRPFMRMIVQPYIVAGLGEKFYRVDHSASVATDFDTRRFAFHGGVGADLMIGSIGIAAEVTDFVSKGLGQNWNVHDAFAMAGIRVRLP